MIAWGDSQIVPGPLGLLQRSEVIEVQRSYSGALFEQTLFEVLQFEFGKMRFEQVLIAIDVTQMDTQTGNALVHSHRFRNKLIPNNIQLKRENAAKFRR